ncbi:MAG: hypothetical protein MUF13_17585 [Akkermansiaceae bacterium]|nr:hypothetical protein [Akkermansiaceae bacterium]
MRRIRQILLIFALSITIGMLLFIRLQGDDFLGIQTGWWLIGGMVPLFTIGVLMIANWKCPKCNSGLGRGIVKFCDNCGKKVE